MEEEQGSEDPAQPGVCPAPGLTVVLWRPLGGVTAVFRKRQCWVLECRWAWLCYRHCIQIGVVLCALALAP